MAIPSNAVWEVRLGGNDTNGGGFVPGGSGTDYSVQDSKNTTGNNISTTDAVSNGTTTITSATINATSDLVNNIVYFSGGSGSITPVRKRVTGVTNSTTITIDSSIASSTGLTMNVGGALATPGYAASQMSGGNQLTFLKYDASVFAITTASTNISNGCVDLSVAGSMCGYDTNRSSG